MAVKTYNNIVREFVNMADAMNRANNTYDYARNGGSDGGNNGEGAPVKRAARLPIDAWANDEAFSIKAYLPGVSLEDVEITFEGEELTIHGHYPESEEEVEFVTRELFHGEFERRLTFNVPVNVDEIEATFENGVLALSVPKAEEIRPKQIKVQVK